MLCRGFALHHMYNNIANYFECMHNYTVHTWMEAGNELYWGPLEVISAVVEFTGGLNFTRGAKSTFELELNMIFNSPGSQKFYISQGGSITYYGIG